MKVNFMPLITGDDDLTVEPAYVWWTVGVVSYLVLTAFNLYKGIPVGLQEFSTGFGIVLACGGAGKLMGK